MIGWLPSQMYPENAQQAEMLTSAAMRAVRPHICRHPSPATSCKSEAPYIASCENEVP